MVGGMDEVQEKAAAMATRRSRAKRPRAGGGDESAPPSSFLFFAASAQHGTGPVRRTRAIAALRRAPGRASMMLEAGALNSHHSAQAATFGARRRAGRASGRCITDRGVLLNNGNLHDLMGR
eukprot:3765311-Prymnesium_polylepis.2